MEALLIMETPTLHVLHIEISVSSKAPNFLFVSAAPPTPEKSVYGLSWEKRYCRYP